MQKIYRQNDVLDNRYPFHVLHHGAAYAKHDDHILCADILLFGVRV